MTNIYLQNFVKFSIIETAGVWKNTVVDKKQLIQILTLSWHLEVSNSPSNLWKLRLYALSWSCNHNMPALSCSVFSYLAVRKITSDHHMRNFVKDMFLKSIFLFVSSFSYQFLTFPLSRDKYDLMTRKLEAVQ